jgi:serine/threonine protein kinase
MHRVGIGHLDVKPSNVILRSGPTPESLSPVLVDFGLAGRHLRPGCGTGQYGAPEVWGLIPPGITPRPAHADVYAFACLAYEAVTGKPLFDGHNELAVINAHLSHDGTPPELRWMRERRGLMELAELLANALRRHPEERINVAELREGFRELGPALCKHPWPLRAA